MTRVIVLTGGATPERDVAFAGAAQVVGALRDTGYRVTVVDTVSGPLDEAAEARYLVPTVGQAPPDPETLSRLAAAEQPTALVELPAVQDADLVFPVLHGRLGEGGELQALLELAGIPYAGSGPLGSALAMDKDVSKRLLRQAGVPTASWALWPVDPDRVTALGLPLIVKPVKVGSTVGLTVLKDANGLADAVADAARWDDEVMLEVFLPGREFTVGVLGEEALAVGEIIPSHEIFDYECKYTPGLTREVFPADLPDDVAAHMQELALTVHRTLKLRDFSRVDFRFDTQGTPHCLEANTLPGLTATSLLPQSAAAAGIPFPELCGRICRMALARAGTRNKVEG